jgi:hypothetical protein
MYLFTYTIIIIHVNLNAVARVKCSPLHPSFGEAGGGGGGGQHIGLIRLKPKAGWRWKGMHENYPEKNLDLPESP